MTSWAYSARSRRSHYDVILIVTSSATELATPTVTDVRTDTLSRLIYKDETKCCLVLTFFCWRCVLYYAVLVQRSSLCALSASSTAYDIIYSLWYHLQHIIITVLVDISSFTNFANVSSLSISLRRLCGFADAQFRLNACNCGQNPPEGTYINNLLAVKQILNMYHWQNARPAKKIINFCEIILPSVLWGGWFGIRKRIWPVKN